MEITSVRHGESKNNLKRVIQGLKGGLTEKGRDETKKLGLRLSENYFDMTYCSDTERTIETAREIMTFHPDTPIKYTPVLREIDGGSYVGKSLEEWEKEREKFKGRDLEFKIEGGENMLEAIERIRNFLKGIYPLHETGDILLVTHGGVNKALRYLSQGFEGITKEPEDFEQANCCVNFFRYHNEDILETNLYNCTKHFEQTNK